MNKWRCLLFILACLSQMGCAALLTEQEYILINRTDAIKIIKHSMTGAGRIETVQFYTVADKGN